MALRESERESERERERELPANGRGFSEGYFFQQKMGLGYSKFLMNFSPRHQCVSSFLLLHAHLSPWPLMQMHQVWLHLHSLLLLLLLLTGGDPILLWPMQRMEGGRGKERRAQPPSPDPTLTWLQPPHSLYPLIIP